MPRGVMKCPEQRIPTAKQQKFIESMMRQGNPTTAYKEAGYKFLDDDGKLVRWLSARVSKVRNTPVIASTLARISEDKLQRRVDRESYTRDWVLFELQETVDTAKKLNKTSDVISALMGIAKIIGILNDTLTVDLVGIKQFDELKQREAKRITATLLTLPPVEDNALESSTEPSEAIVEQGGDNTTKEGHNPPGGAG